MTAASHTLHGAQAEAGSLFMMEEKVFEIIKTRQKVVGFEMDNISLTLITSRSSRNITT